MLIDDVKQVLRISNTAYDVEITDLIEACKLDLKLAGVLTISETDKLIKRAILVYVKANFGYDNPDADRLLKAYKMLRNHLAISIDYAYYSVTINAGSQCTVTFNGEAKQTNTTGTAIFHSRTKNHVSYIVNGVTNYIDITGNTVIGA